MARRPSPAATAALNEAAIQNPGAVPDVHGELKGGSYAGEKCIVGCKLDVAYYDLQLCALEEVYGWLPGKADYRERRGPQPRY
jgi:hypothetical protein